MVYVPRLGKIDQDSLCTKIRKDWPSSGVFNQFFSDEEEIKNNFSFIDVNQLSSKCIIKRTLHNNKYLISEFIISDEHD